MTTMVLRSHERAVVLVNGRVEQVLGEGRHRLPRRRPGRSVEVRRVDVRRTWVVLPNQEVMAADVPGVRVSLAAEWRIADPVAWLDVAREPNDALWIAVQLAVRDAFAARPVDVLVADRSGVAAELRSRVAAEVEPIGIEVLRVEIRDLAPPPEVRRSALALHTARADGLAQLERARAETAALRALANGAKVLADHPGLLQLRTAETVAQSGGVVKLSVGP
jgi:regulator of protease activity HflC (stomatin/prohibitin superfamily)